MQSFIRHLLKRVLFAPVGVWHRRGVTASDHTDTMLFEMTAQYERHRRTVPFEAHCADCAPEAALLLAKFHAKGKGTYGPLAWTYGRLTIWSLMTEPVVIRQKRPYLRVVR